MKRFPVDDWKKVVFTDESKICMHGPDGNRRVWRRPGGALLDHHIIPTVKFGVGRLWFGEQLHIME